MDDGSKSSNHKSNLKKKRGAKKDKEDKKGEKPTKKAKTEEWAGSSCYLEFYLQNLLIVYHQGLSRISELYWI